MQKINTNLGITILVIVAAIAGGVIYFNYSSFSLPVPSFFSFLLPSPSPEIEDVKRFASKEEFITYLQEGQSGARYYYISGMGGARVPVSMVEETFLPKDAGGGIPENAVSDSQVAVMTVDAVAVAICRVPRDRTVGDGRVTGAVHAAAAK